MVDDDDDENYVKITVGPGSLGMELEEVDEEACVVKVIEPGGQGDKLGFRVGDESVSVGEHEIPNDNTAYSIVLTNLKTQPRPLSVVMYRDPDFVAEDEHHHHSNSKLNFDIEFELPAGHLGWRWS